jgi:hypothetical protein
MVSLEFQTMTTVLCTRSLPLNTTLSCWITFCYFVTKASSYRDSLHILTWTAIDLSGLRMKYVSGPIRQGYSYLTNSIGSSNVIKM